MSLRNEAQFVVSNDAMTQKPQQDTNPPYGGVVSVGGGLLFRDFHF